MRQAIVTKYLGPTNLRASRVKATAQAGSITVYWDDALNESANHAAVARALAVKLGWTGGFVGGGMPQGLGYCFVSTLTDGPAHHFEVP